MCIFLGAHSAGFAQTPPAPAMPTPVAAPTAAPAPPDSAASAIQDEPVERTLFDLYLSDAFQGGALANYTEKWCEVDDPLGTLTQIPEFRRERAEELVPLLAGRIEGTREIKGLGQVVCDIYTFRLVLKLDPAYLKAPSRALSARLPEPDGGLSLQQNVGVAASGEFTGDTSSAFSHRTVIGSGRYFGRFNGAAVQNEPYELTEASAFGYLGDYEIGSGFLESTGQSFANSLQYTGVRVRTSDKLLLNPEEGRGSRLEVFIPSRSRVEFYRAGRLLLVQVLDFGLQEIDTTLFPQGSYDVDVVITESNGNVTRDRKFFTKSGFLSIRGRPSYDLQAGVTRDEFTTLDTPLYYGGVQWRAADAFDIGASIYGNDEFAIAQVQFNALYRESYLLASGSFSSEGDVGINGNFSTNVYGFTLNLGGAQSLEVSENSQQLAFTPTPEPDAPPDFIPTRNRSTELYFQDRYLYTANVRRSFGRFDLSYSIQSEDFAGDELRRSKGPSVQWNVFDGDEDNIRFVASYYNTEEGDIQSDSLYYRHRLSSAWNLGAQMSYYNRETTDEVVGYLNVSYEGHRRSQYTSRFNLSSESRRTTPDGGGKASSVYTNQVVGEYGGDYLYGSGFLRDQGGSNAGKSSFGVNAESAVLVSDNGSTAISYPMAQDAVFIADIEGASPGTKFEILLNDQVYDTVEAGKRSAVSVTPFKTYRVGIRPSDANQLVEYDTTTHIITFFPGNVVERTWSVSQVVIVLGRLVKPDGSPIGLERIRGTREYVATDDQGNFQAELSGDENLTVEGREMKCKLELPTYERPEYFIELGDVVCR